METYRYTVSLRIWHPSRDPATFTTALNLLPLYCDKAGERRVRKGKALDIIEKDSYWSHEFEAAAGPEDLEDFLLSRVQSLARHKHFFTELGVGAGRAEFFIGFFPENFNCGFGLSPHLQRQCADLNLTLAFDIYGFDRDTSEEA
ncbi:MAG: DUF4279 domain-containing protein [Pseudomonas sp.]|uniref:DUF4279 domain-containing protein n=1 Tax=Pseudomonas sp. TaxID=306 RepID=UPI003391A1D8